MRDEAGHTAAIEDIGELVGLRREVAREAAPRPGDEAMISGLVRSVIADPVAGPQNTPRRWFPMAVAAGAIVVASAVAGAAIWEGARPETGQAPELPRSSPTPQTRQRPSSGVRTPAPPLAPAGAVEPTGAAAPPGASVAEPLAPGRTAMRPRGNDARGLTPSRNSAAALFGEANRLRRAGDYRAAAAAYERLQRTYPGARQDFTTRVILGQLMLDRFDRPQRGIELFDSYLADHPDGALVEDARFGRARALRRTGQTSLERAAWQDLLRSHPRSVYAPEARRRLAELP